MRDFVRAFKVLSDETRIRIMKVILERECCVCEVMQALDISQSRASRNLGILEDAGFVRSRRDGPWIIYLIAEETVSSYAAYLTKMVRDILINEDIVLRDKQRLSRAVRIQPRAK